MMIERRSWGDVARDLASTHAEHGDAVSFLHPVPEDSMPDMVIVNTCRDLLVVDMPISARRVRRWLWSHGRARAFHRLGGLVWSNTWGDKARVGYGSLVPSEVARRLDRMTLRGAA